MSIELSESMIAARQGSVAPATNRPNLTGSILEPASWSAHQLMFTSADTGAANLYWPWVIKTDKISAPLDAYYMYFSTDHNSGVGGIYMASAPSPLGPWTQRGLVYVDPASSWGSNVGQTETPAVVWDQHNSVLRMFYQQSGAKYGASNVTNALGDQSTLSATSTDGVTWTKDPAFVLDIPAANYVYGNGHTGYFLPFQTRTGMYAYSLAGGTDFGAFTMWRCRGQLNDWQSNWQKLPFSQEFTQGGTLAGRRIEWNSCFVANSGGVDYLIGRASDGASGGATSNCRIVAARISPSYDSIIERPTVIWSPVEAWESTDMRSVCPYIENGVLYVYYTINKTHIGVITHVL